MVYKFDGIVYILSLSKCIILTVHFENLFIYELSLMAFLYPFVSKNIYSTLLWILRFSQSVRFFIWLLFGNRIWFVMESIVLKKILLRVICDILNINWIIYTRIKIHHLVRWILISLNGFTLTTLWEIVFPKWWLHKAYCLHVLIESNE